MKNSATLYQVLHYLRGLSEIACFSEKELILHYIVCLPAYFQSNQLSKANHKRAHSENELRSEATKGG